MQFLRKLYRLLFSWNFPAASEKELVEADAIIAMAFGATKDGSPGRGNHTIARVTEELLQKYHLPLLAEWYMAQANPALPYVLIAKPTPAGNEPSTSAYHTQTVAQELARECWKKGWRKIIVLASPDHMGRVIWTYEKLGMEVFPAKMPNDGYYGSGYVQTWSHSSRWRWRCKEVLVRILFWYWGYI
ncbi:MAG: hypothetical protein Q8R26_03960 [bacterium]|nr:hypothetical protein [bacterium]